MILRGIGEIFFFVEVDVGGNCVGEDHHSRVVDAEQVVGLEDVVGQHLDYVLFVACENGKEGNR